jgi:hypothetical protein
MRASGSNSVSLEGVELPDAAVRGGFQAGDPLPYMERNLVAGLFHAAGSLGIAESADAIARHGLGGRINGDARPRMQVAENAVDLSAARGVLSRETWPLAFQRFAGGDWDIWSTIGRGNASNGEPATFGTATALVSGPGDQECPAYSRIAAGVAPLLAYTSTQTGARELWLRDAAGDLKQLTGDGAGYANPDFAGRYRLVDADGDGGFDTPRIGWSSNAWSQAPAAFGRWTSTSASTRARTSPRAGCDLSPPAPETSSTPRGRRPTTSTSARRRRR